MPAHLMLKMLLNFIGNSDIVTLSVVSDALATSSKLKQRRCLASTLSRLLHVTAH